VLVVLRAPVLEGLERRAVEAADLLARGVRLVLGRFAAAVLEAAFARAGFVLADLLGDVFAVGLMVIWRDLLIAFDDLVRRISNRE
jgi:hypothetical protein